MIHSSCLATFQIAAVLLAFSSPAAAQLGALPPALPSHAPTLQLSAPRPADTVGLPIAAGERYQAGGLQRWFAGNAYRDLWTMSIGVPVLDLRTYAGGLHPTKVGGGLQTKSLRLETTDGTEYVFRLSDKDSNSAPGVLRDTFVGGIFQDQVSALHPAAALLSAPLMKAAGVPHPEPELMVMPDDPLLGEFRAEFAGKLGMIEQFPSVPEHGLAFGATKIIDSQELVLLLDSDATQRVDARTFLAARLVDFLINDSDRHAGNWRWARLESEADSEWKPISRDRDHAFVSYEGFLLRTARLMAPILVQWDGIPDVEGLTQHQDIDSRLLGGLGKPVWDSVALALQKGITDAVINAATSAMPVEYQGTAPALAAVLRTRLAALPGAANEYYHLLAARVDIHGTAAPDRALITRVDDRFVDVRLEAGGHQFYARRFDARETSEILVYLHDGDDSALTAGHVRQSILVRVIGGNGANALIDSSTVADGQSATRLYDTGTVTGVTYGLDTLFSRRPWEKKDGELVPPNRDVGVRYAPLGGASFSQDIGIAPRIGVVRYAYGFRHRPYASMVMLEGEYGLTLHGLRVGLRADKRLESSPLHLTLLARMSDFEVVRFGGLGNQTPAAIGTDPLFEVRQRQWLLHPAIALAVGPRVDLSLGPLLQRAVTDSARSRYVSDTRTYGSGTFDQVGVQLGASYEWRGAPDDDEQSRNRVLVELDGAHFPAAMDVRSAFQATMLGVRTSFTLPVPTGPSLVVRAGGTKLFGDFPFHQAATIGGEGTTRYMDTERYAGDGSLYASSELRVQVARFKLMVPLRLGVVGLAEAGRVYVDGSSPGGWHERTGGGVWVGLGEMSPVVTLTRTTEPGRPAVHVRFGLVF